MIPQAQGTRAGARAPSALRPRGKGIPSRKPIGPSSASATAMRAGVGHPWGGLEDARQQPDIGAAHDDDPGRGEGDRRYAAGTAREPIGHAGAQAGEHQEAGEHRRDGVERVPEKDREALHEGDLDEEEGQAQAREEERDTPVRRRTRGLVRRARRAQREQRQQDQQHGGNRALHQRRDQDDEAPFDQRQAALRPQRQKLGQGRPFEGVEEEGAVVGVAGRSANL